MPLCIRPASLVVVDDDDVDDDDDSFGDVRLRSYSFNALEMGEMLFE